MPRAVRESGSRSVVPETIRRARADSQLEAPKADAVVAQLRKMGSKRVREEMGPRYGVYTDKAFGVPVGKIKELAKRLKRKDAPRANHELAAALWETGWYDARQLAAFIDEPCLVTPAQMDRWGKDFDNWAICDGVCFHLFDRTPHAFGKIAKWAKSRDAFVKRAAFAVLWGLTVHDKASGDGPFLEGLRLIEAAASDERHYVKKAVNMALRAIGKRNRALSAAAKETARRLAEADDASARWVGKDALRELSTAKVRG